MTDQTPAPEPLLEVEGLCTSFFAPAGEFRAVDRVSFCVRRGEVVGLVGESGSGKTLTALSIMRLIDDPGRIVAGHVIFRGRDLLAVDERVMRRVRGGEIAMIWQDPMASLNPVKRIGTQIAEAIRLHPERAGGAGYGAGPGSVRARAIAALREVHVPDPERRARGYPHQLSGGLQQRVMIAMALACRPALLIADEPTTALDVTIQRQILELLKELQARTAMSVLLITHDLGVVAETCHRVNVMYAGRIVESVAADRLFERPAHPYTRSLIGSIPRRETARGGLVAMPGRMPDLARVPPGCPFHPRCPQAMAICRTQEPRPVRLAAGHAVSCHLHGP
jgi:oligopeptide/dipeptide ABC transporter ATP-binding protein